MKIFEIRDHMAFPTEEILLVFPFDEIWQRDTSSGKDIALREFTYIEFMTSPKETNPFYGYPQSTVEPLRSLKIIENKFKDYPDWYPDEIVNMAVEQYREFYYNASPTLKYYESNVRAANKLQMFFDNFNMTATNERSGAPLYKPKEITSALIDSDNVMAKLASMKDRVNQEVFDVAKTKGNKRISKFEA